MGDTYQTIVDRDAGEDDAEALAARVVDYLIGRGVVAPTCADNMLGGGDRMAYSPGPLAEDAVEAQIHDEARHGLPHLDVHETRPNGLAVNVGRRVFYSMMGEQAVVCRSCGSRVALDAFSPALDAALDEWIAGTAAGRFACPLCGTDDPISDWNWDPPWAFASLGFTFWNWPPLSHDFVRDLANLLGHRLVVVSGKI